MATREAGAVLPVVKVHSTHADLGRAMGEAQAPRIRAVVASTLEMLREQEITERTLHEQIAPYAEAAERIFPHLMVELRAMAAAADVPFDMLFRFNCWESRPPGSRGPWGGPTPRAAVSGKDPTVLAQADGGPPEQTPAAAGTSAAHGDGCTSVVSRSGGGWVVGHTEDSWAEAIDGLYLLDAAVDPPNSLGAPAPSRFLAMNYAQTLPGCSAAVNGHGLVVLIDALPDPDRRIGAPRHFVSRALLDAPTIDAALDLLRTTERGGGWNYLLVQGERMANVETTATRVVVTDTGERGTYVHTNHFLDRDVATAAGDARPNSLTRLARATELVRPGMDLPAIKRLLADRQGFPDSICRERTIGAFVADTAARRVEVCWGEPDTATWAVYGY